MLSRLLDPEKMMVSKADAPMNAEVPMLVTLLGIVMLSKLVASWNAVLSMLVRLSDAENVTLVRFVAL